MILKTKLPKAISLMEEPIPKAMNYINNVNKDKLIKMIQEDRNLSDL